MLLRGQAVTADGTTLRTCFAYDGLGRKISETGPNGTAGLSACPASAPTSALPYTVSTRYDADGRGTGTIAPDPDGAGTLPHPAVRNSYDPAGRLIRVEEGSLAAWQPDHVLPALWPGFAVHRFVDTSYDALDRKTREQVGGIGPAGAVTAAVTEYGYDLAGRLKCTAARMNPDAWGGSAGRPLLSRTEARGEWLRPGHQDRLRRGRAAGPGERRSRNRAGAGRGDLDL